MNSFKKQSYTFFYLLIFILIFALSGTGCNGGSSGTKDNPGQSKPLLSKPQNIEAVSGDSMVKISWEPVENAKSYTLYWGENKKTLFSNGFTAKKITNTFKQIENLIPGTEIFYSVEAENSESSGIKSEIKSITVLGSLEKPLNVKAEKLEQSGIRVSWDKVAGAEEYSLSWSEDSNPGTTNFICVNNLKDNFWVHKNAVRNTTYYYDVIAQGKISASPVSERVSSSTEKGLLPSPGNVFPQKTANSVKLSWSSVDGADRYMVYISQKRENLTNSLSLCQNFETNPLPGQQQNFTIENIEPGKMCFFCVKAIDKSNPLLSSNISFIVSSYINDTPIEPAEVIVSNDDFTFKADFVCLPKGEFWMGSSQNKDEDFHKVVLTKSFYIMTKEVTQKQWESIMKTNPSSCQHSNSSIFDPAYPPYLPPVIYPENTESCPVENISLSEIKNFITKLNSTDSKYKFRLPTEAEWEYAAKAGTSTPYAIGNGYTLEKGEARFSGSPSDTTGTSFTGSFSPNPWKIFDMHGNVAEFTSDAWRQSLGTETTVDPSFNFYIEQEDQSDCIKSGSYHFSSNRLRSSFRQKNAFNNRNSSTGFRLAAELKLN